MSDLHPSPERLLEAAADGLAGARSTGDRRDLSREITVIRPATGFIPRFDLRSVWDYRELLVFLVLRDVKVKYKQTVLGVGWAVIQPFVTMIIFSLVFGHLAGIKSDYGVPYPLFVFAGMLPWTYFTTSLSLSSSSLLGSQSLITKVYFPRVIVPLASVVSPLIDFFFAFLILCGMFAWYGQAPDWRAIAIPVFLGVALLTSFGVGLWLSSATVRYRDVPYAIPFLVQVWFFCTPVIYPVTLLPQDWRWLLAINPMTGVIGIFRWAVLGRGVPDYTQFGISAGVGLALVVTGLWHFKRTERTFADVI